MVQFSDIKKLSNGANFYNVDLHIHSYGGSHDVKDSSMTPEAIVDSAVRQGIFIIAITDHNSITNVEKAISYAQEYYPDKILVLAGVEVTTAHGHLLVYLAPENTSALSSFIYRLELIGEMGAAETHTKKSMADTISEAEKLGGICVAAHIDRERSGFDALSESFQNWKKDIINHSGLYGLECDDIQSIRRYSEEDEHGPTGAERTKLFLSRKLNPYLKTRYHLAHIQGSDSHSMTQFENQEPEKLWTRMKLTELSYNAFRVAMIDPTARVRACKSVPRSFPRIKGIFFSGGFLHNEIVHFSDNLNCFIGGRGTGKSTAIRALSFAFGVNDGFGDFGNCPDSVTVYCEDENQVQYRYCRVRNGDLTVKAKEDESIVDVPMDAFRIEYYGQGELAKVAENPLKKPELFQEFLDRHIHLHDLYEKEKSYILNLKDNAARLIPLEQSYNQLEDKKKLLDEVEKKLKVAEEGKLREIVSIQSKIASEKALRETITSISNKYKNGYILGNLIYNFDQITKTSGSFTDNEQSGIAISTIKKILDKNADYIKLKEIEINNSLKDIAQQLNQQVEKLKNSHDEMNNDVISKLSDLKSRGIVTDLTGLDALLKEKTNLASEISFIEQLEDERKQCIEQRKQLLIGLEGIRHEMTSRRKSQLRGINSNLGQTIKDYTIFIKYDESGITTDFVNYIQGKMQGTYLQESIIDSLCNSITPNELADLIHNRDAMGITNKTHITFEWSQRIVEKLCYWKTIFELQILRKQPKPIITVKTKGFPSNEIPVLQLSDGQRHTILLTIAMLAESNIPLIIDQPEDDLDNAFIFSSIVETLRLIKERRQVILVTHNANIAVLGDSEQIFPMYRENNLGKIIERGAIDSEATRQKVIDILEGGGDAFLRRKEMYNH